MGFHFMDFRAIYFSMRKPSSFLHRLTERVTSNFRFNLCLVVCFNRLSLDRILLSGIQIRPHHRHTHPACGRSPRIFRVRKGFWGTTLSDKHSQILTSSPWQALEIRADPQADSPLGGDMDVCRNSIRDRFVLLSPRWPTWVTNGPQLLVW